MLDFGWALIGAIVLHLWLHFYNQASYQGLGDEVYAHRFASNLMWACFWAVVLVCYLINIWLAVGIMALLLPSLYRSDIMRNI